MILEDGRTGLVSFGGGGLRSLDGDCMYRYGSVILEDGRTGWATGLVSFGGGLLGAEVS